MRGGGRGGPPRRSETEAEAEAEAEAGAGAEAEAKKEVEVEVEVEVEEEAEAEGADGRRAGGEVEGGRRGTATAGGRPTGIAGRTRFS